MSGRRTRGRQRIPIRHIENQDHLYATFSKRRAGLYKKASELCTLCGVDIGIVIFSPTNNPHSFFHPDMQSIVDMYRNPNQPINNYARIFASQNGSRIEDLNRRLDDILEEKERRKEHNESLEEFDKTREKGWWEDIPLESLNKEQVKELMTWFEAFKAQVQSQTEKLKNGGSTSAIQYYGDAQDPFSTSGNSHIAGQYFCPLPPQISISLPSHDPFGGGSSQFFLSSPPLDGHDGSGSVDPTHGQYNYVFPRRPSTTGGSGEDSHGDEQGGEGK